MKILAIRLARFGDVVLLLPALSSLKSSSIDSHITFLTDHRLVPLAEMCPAIDDVIAVDRISMRDGSRTATLRSMYQVVSDIRKRRFDLVVDFHGFRETNLLAWLSGARHRVGLKRFDQSYLNFCFNLPPVLEDKSIHVAEMFQRMADQISIQRSPHPASQPQALVVPDTGRKWAGEKLPARSFAALYVDAPTPKRIWPADRFAALADFIAGRLDMDVVVVAGSEGTHLTKQVREASRFPERVHAFFNLQVTELAALVASAQLWISNDTGPMHLGPILNVPTLGLFSIGLPEHFKPVGPRNLFVQGNPIERITVAEVIGQIENLVSTGRPDPQR
jgi:ADP-heptose:LPS heptosyltransferase